MPGRHLLQSVRVSGLGLGTFFLIFFGYGILPLLALAPPKCTAVCMLVDPSCRSRPASSLVLTRRICVFLAMRSCLDFDVSLAFHCRLPALTPPQRSPSPALFLHSPSTNTHLLAIGTGPRSQGAESTHSMQCFAWDYLPTNVKDKICEVSFLSDQTA